MYLRLLVFSVVLLATSIGQCGDRLRFRSHPPVFGHYRGVTPVHGGFPGGYYCQPAYIVPDYPGPAFAPMVPVNPVAGPPPGAVNAPAPPSFYGYYSAATRRYGERPYYIQQNILYRDR